jgi:hypothetical protein
MKKLTLTIVLLLVVTSLFSALPILDFVLAGVDIATTRKITKADIDGQEIKFGGTSIKQLKKSLNTYDFTTLDFEDRLYLYGKGEVPLTIPIVKSIFLGMGSGSKSQGDLGGKLFGVAADSVSYGLITAGITFYIIDMIFVGSLSSAFGGEWNPNDPNSELQSYARGFLYGGLAALGASRIIQIILPINYAAKYNKTLRNSLGITKDKQDAFSFNVGFVPNVNFDPAVQLSAKISF